MRAVHRVWSQPSGSPACEARLAVPGVWAGDRQAGSFPRHGGEAPLQGPGACGSARRPAFRRGRPFSISFLTVGVT